MGYAYYEREGMERGYSVPDKCHAEDCDAEIDRGLAHLCYSCLLYFCGEHLTYAFGPDGNTEILFDCFAGEKGQCCEKCGREAETRAVLCLCGCERGEHTFAPDGQSVCDLCGCEEFTATQAETAEAING